MSTKTIIRLILFVATVCVVSGLCLFTYSYLAIEAETQRVEAAILRDCSADLEISLDDIDEPGVVYMNYLDHETPMTLICMGTNWRCECAEDVP